MKPTEWTPKEKALFFNHLTGNSYSSYYYYGNREGFFLVKEYMEKEMPKQWTIFLDNMLAKYEDTIEAFNAQLSLDNLLSFLLSNTEEWGRVKQDAKGIASCGNCSKWMKISCPREAKGIKPSSIDDCKDYTRDTRYVRHPALVFAESLKDSQ